MLHQHGMDDLLGQLDGIHQEADQFFGDVMDSLEAAWRQALTRHDGAAPGATISPKVEQQLAQIEQAVAALGQGIAELQGLRDTVQSQGRQFLEAVDATLRRELDQRAANSAPSAVPEKLQQQLSEMERAMAAFGQRLGELHGLRDAVQSQGRQFLEAVDATLRRELDQRAANPSPPVMPEKVEQQLTEIERAMAAVGKRLGDLRELRDAVQSQSKQFTEVVDAALRRELDQRAANPTPSAVPEKVEQQLSEIEQAVAAIGKKVGELHELRDVVRAQGEQFTEAVDVALRRELDQRTASPAPSAVPEKVEQQLTEIERVMSAVGQRLTDLHGWRDALQTQSKQFMDALDAVAARMSVQAMISGNSDAGEKTEQQLREIERAMAALGKQLADLHGWRDALQTQGKQVTQLAEELNAARQDLSGMREALDQHAEQKPDPVVVPTVDPELQRRLGEAEEQCSALQQERAALEAELEAVRNRAAEMADATAQQKRQMHEQQAQWASEFKRMRALLEGLCKQLEDQPPPASAAAVSAEHAASADLVLDSLANQFEMLQRDVARRRSAMGKTGQ